MCALSLINEESTNPKRAVLRSYLEHLARTRAQNLLQPADHYAALAGGVLEQTQRFALGLGRFGVVDRRGQKIGEFLIVQF